MNVGADWSGMMDWFSFTFGLAVGMAVMGVICAYLMSR